MTPRAMEPTSERLPEPEGEGWDEEVRITKRDLHAMLNAHGDVVRATALQEISMKVYVIVEGFDCESIEVFATRALAEARLSARVDEAAASLSGRHSPEEIERFRQYRFGQYIEEVEVISA
jgi:hypothetical protein